MTDSNYICRNYLAERKKALENTGNYLIPNFLGEFPGPGSAIEGTFFSPIPIDTLFELQDRLYQKEKKPKSEKNNIEINQDYFNQF